MLEALIDESPPGLNLLGWSRALWELSVLPKKAMHDRPCMTVNRTRTTRSKVQSTLALRTPCYYGHPANADSCWIPGENYRHLTETNLTKPLSVPTVQFYCSNSRYNGHQSASFDILAELSQNIIYFFLFFSSCLPLWLKSEQSDSRLTWSFYETTVLTLKKTVMMYLINSIF